MLAANLANDLTKRVILDVLKLYHDKLCVFFISDVVVLNKSSVAVNLSPGRLVRMLWLESISVCLLYK